MSARLPAFSLLLRGSRRVRFSPHISKGNLMISREEQQISKAKINIFLLHLLLVAGLWLMHQWPTYVGTITGSSPIKIPATSYEIAGTLMYSVVTRPIQVHETGLSGPESDWKRHRARECRRFHTAHGQPRQSQRGCSPYQA